WNMYIAGEVGGMAESLARLSEMTGTAEEKSHLLEAANYFDSPAFFDPLAKNVDAIRTRHANQHIPMVTGALRSFRSNNNPYYYNLAQNFWTMVQGRYRYAMGGVGNGEMFRQPYSQITSMCTNVTSWGGRELHPEPTINETCCAYNLAKLTKDLNCFNPDDARYMDYYERVLYNQIVGSVNPRKYQTVYQYAVGLDASKPWGNETPQATCCGGTGVENHVKYQEAAYFTNDNTIWVALYLPTTARWTKKGVIIRQECQWPAERSTIRITKGKGYFAMKLRVPYWATEGFDVRLNGKSIAKEYQPSSYVEIPSRKWSKKDVVEVVMPFTKHIDFGPDKMETAPAYEKGGKTEYTPMWAGAFMYGPLVMATTGVSNWDDATIDVAPDLSDVTLMGATDGSGADAHLYTLRHGGHSFIPDYAGDKHLTHYFRMNIPADPNAVANNAGNTAADKSQLRELLLIANNRINEQQAWEALTVKVPEYAPWAAHGFARMTEQSEKVRPLMEAPEGKYSQEEIDKAAGALNAAINTMRPGNLPELEDMDELMHLLEKAKLLPADNEKANRAISYAGMVIRYVSDGSGTMDMIQRATNQLKEVLK
ncbi:MAG: glycoside hydrolase family 127 protein, partial [Prevotella sp.]|nr:glycoside hydrolase family 127 protein [Prevotella sp.]